MNKQTLLTGAALVLAAIYIANFTDWFKHKSIQVVWRISPASGKVVFYLDKPYALTSVEVVSAADARTNKFPHPLWHIVAKSASEPTTTFNYGADIPGMKPKVATAQPESLQPETDYSLLVEAAGKLKGEMPFTLK